jgi:hypothetical protein
MMDEAALTGLKDVKRGLKWIMGVLEGEGAQNEFSLKPAAAKAAKTAKAAPAKAGKTKKK